MRDVTRCEDLKTSLRLNVKAFFFQKKMGEGGGGEREDLTNSVPPFSIVAMDRAC